MTPLRVAALLFIPLLLIPTPATLAANDEGVLESTNRILRSMSYEVDPPSMKKEFRDSGALRLLVPALGEIVIHGAEVDIWAERKWFVASASREDILREGVIDDIPIVGRVEGDPTSMARPYIGLYGIYGRVTTQGFAFDFDPTMEDGKYIQNVVMRELTAPIDGAWFRPLDDVRAMGLSTSYVVYDVELEYQTTHGDWISRTSSAFSNLYPMWTDANLDLRLSGPWGWDHDWVLTTDAGTALHNYADWLENHLTSYANAYQAITARNLDGSSTYGRSFGDTVRIDVTNNQYASSVVEMTNFCCDLYDANSAYERGIVSGHEFTHIYGEEDEETGCVFYPYDCNIMQPYVDNSARNFYWRGDTICEISSRFYDGEEC